MLLIHSSPEDYGNVGFLRRTIDSSRGHLEDLLKLFRCGLNFSDQFRSISVDCETQEWWAERDEKLEYPHELHAALSKDGWIGIALPEHLGGSGLGISEATMMLHTISE